MLELEYLILATREGFSRYDDLALITRLVNDNNDKIISVTYDSIAAGFVVVIETSNIYDIDYNPFRVVTYPLPLDLVQKMWYNDYRKMKGKPNMKYDVMYYRADELYVETVEAASRNLAIEKVRENNDVPLEIWDVHETEGGN